MTDEPPAQLPAPALIALPPPPADVTDALELLRVACAQWAPRPGVSDHQTVAHVCDVVLDRDQQFETGAGFGVVYTLAAVGFLMACWALIRARPIDRFEDLVAYLALGLLAIPAGIVTGSLVVRNYGQFFPTGEVRLAIAAGVLAVARMLAALRWWRQRRLAVAT